MFLISTILKEYFLSIFLQNASHLFIKAMGVLDNRLVNFDVRDRQMQL